MTKGKKLFLFGCLGVPLGLLLLASVVVGVALLLPAPEPEPVSEVLNPTLGPTPAAAPGSGSEIELEPAATARPIELDFQECELKVRAAEPGEPLRIEAEYDKSAYGLVTETVDGVFQIRFERTIGMLGLLARVRDGEVEGNRIVVYLPRGAPLALGTRFRRGELRLDLTGVSVAGLDLDMAMGEARVRFDEPNPVFLEQVRVNARMGEMRLQGLGYAAPGRVDVRGRMGEFRVDFDGGLRDDAAIAMRVRMGDGILELPDEAAVAYARRKVKFADMALRSAEAVSADELETATATATVDVDVAFGSISVR